MKSHVNSLLGLGVAGWVAGAVLAQRAEACPPTDDASESRQAAPVQPAPSAPIAAAAKTPEQIKSKLDAEREMKKIRAKHFGSMQNKEIRQIGIAKLRQFSDASHFPSLLSIYDHEDADVRGAILDIFADANSDEGDAAIAWGAIKDRQAWYRDLAAARLAKRTDEVGKVSNLVKWVIDNGLKSASNTDAGAAAELCEKLRLYEAIPAIINAQVRGAPSGGGGGGIDVPVDGSTMSAIADIMIATQQAYVSDLQPVVGDSAVGFDPTVSVVTEGSYLRIMGASVVTYRTEVNRALIGLANSGWDGRSTAPLGWDAEKWRSWYANEFKPYRAKIEAEAAAKGEQAAVAKP